MERQSWLISSVIVVTAFAVIAAAAYYVRAPIRHAAQIKIGDNAAQVHALLGEPELVFQTTAELQSSYLKSYTFSDVLGSNKYKGDKLPPVARRAEWFGYASAGHLVYYDDTGVAGVLWGGT